MQVYLECKIHAGDISDWDNRRANDQRRMSSWSLGSLIGSGRMTLICYRDMRRIEKILKACHYISCLHVDLFPRRSWLLFQRYVGCLYGRAVLSWRICPFFVAARCRWFLLGGLSDLPLNFHVFHSLSWIFLKGSRHQSKTLTPSPAESDSLRRL